MEGVPNFPHSQPSLVRWPTARPRSNTTSRIDGHGQEVSRWRLVVLSWKSKIDGSLCGSLPSRKSRPYLRHNTALYAVPSPLERALHTLDTILDILRCGSNFRHQSLHWNTTNQYLRRDGAPIHEVCWSRGTGPRIWVFRGRWIANELVEPAGLRNQDLFSAFISVNT